MQDSVIRPTNTAASRIVATAADKKLVSIADLTAWIAGTASRVTITSDGDGTVTIDVVEAGINHNSLNNLATGDVHTQYLYLPGRGGQTVIDEIIIDPSAGTNALDCQLDITLKSGQKIIYDGA